MTSMPCVANSGRSKQWLVNLESLRQERQQLEKSINQTLSNGRKVLDGQRELVEEFQKQKQKQDSIVDIITPLITYPFHLKK
jgi:seryl-tRNA synthetase